MQYSEKLGSSSTVDDVEGTLSKFIPEGEHTWICYHDLAPLHGQDYYKDEAEFLARVEEDATTFKPSGQLIYSYTRPSTVHSGKGKSAANIQNLDPESEDAVVFEVYHVSIIFLLPRTLPTLVQGDVEYTRVQRISSENATLHPSIY